SARAYYDPACFAAAGIELISFSKPPYVYPQLWGDFIANLSVLDMLFTCGPRARDIIMGY
ncbi:MAG: WbqC family protein, partial [Desulfobulbaceae bacterium]|nr:WbqC family protein [Desulfobulbaceae bacterium]